MTSISLTYFPSYEKLTSLGLSEADINTVIDTLKNEDLHRANNTHTLKTDHKRKTFFKSNFNYVEPMSMYFGQNESGKECFGQYSCEKHH